MRVSIIAVFFIPLFFSCNNHEKTPDVSGININLSINRFERNLFDTTANNLSAYILKLQRNDPSFITTYLATILNVDTSWPPDTAAVYVNGFIKAYRPIYDSSEKVFGDFKPYENDIKKGEKDNWI